ncbi:MAG: DUF5710 domain-containing protein, partial [Devosia sp.]
GDALAFRDQSRRAFGFELPTDWNGRVQVQANVMDGDAVVRADSDAGQAPEFYGVYAQHGDGTHKQLQDLPTLEAAEALAHRIGMVDAHAEINRLDQAAKLARLKEEAVRRDPTSSDGQRDAAKEERKNAGAIAADPDLIARLALARGDTDGHGAKTFIDVPFKQKAKAKALGAKWDRQAQSWFIPSTVDPAPFVRWAKDTPEPVPVPRNTQADTQAAGAQSAPQGRQYLAVPYAERVAAKAFGAEWDKVVKSWYVGPQADAAQLQRWAPENVRSEQEPAMHPRDEFAQAMREHGLVVAGDHPIMDGNKHRVPVEGGKKGAVDGFYVLYPDGHPAGRIINHKTGADETWKSKGYSLSAQEKAVLHAQAAENLARRAATLAAQHEQAAARVSRQLDTLQPVEQPTPYLAAKGVQAHPGAFTDSEQKTTFIPAIDADNKMWSMQYIQEDGTKRFAKDGRKEGCFHAIGGLDALASAPAIVIGEGYATAATLCEALGFSTVAAFDSGNLPAVARALQAKFPAKPIVIAGDDDHHREITEGKNPGREKMEEAAKAVGAAKMLPIFAPGEREAHPNVFTDFNDLATKSALGRGGVERQVRAAVEAAIDKRSAVFEPQEERRLVQTNEHRQGRRPTNTEPVRRKRAARG